MFCTQCGKELPDSAAFCTGCGAQLRKPTGAPEAAPDTTPDESPEVTHAEEAEAAETVEAVEADPETAPAATPEAEAAETASDATPDAESTAAPDAAPSSPAPKKRKSVVIGAAAAIVVVVAGIALYLGFFAPIDISAELFPDAALRNAVAKHADGNGDGKVLRDEIAKLTKLDLSGSDIQSLEGLELFPNLEELDLSDCTKLKGSDFKSVPNLKTLNVSGSGIEKLDVRNLANLTELQASNCPSLQKVNVSGLSNLKTLDLQGSPVTEVNVTDLPGLTNLNVKGVGAISIDLKGDSSLSDLQYDETTTFENLDDTQLREQWVVTKFVRTGANGKSFTFYFEYDGSGKLVRELHGADTVQGCSEYFDFEYDDSGRLVKKTDNAKEGIKQITREYTYGSDGKLQSVSDQSSSNSKIITQYEFDANGHLTKEAQGNLDTRYEYDSKGRLIKRTMNGGSWVYEYTYDSDGHCTSCMKKSGSGQPRGFKATYDSNGNLTACYMDLGIGDQPEYRYKYANGRIVSDDAVIPAGNHKMWGDTYEYDANGNLTHQKGLFYQSSGEATTEATIAYKRIITAKDAPDAFCPLLMGDPTRIPVIVDPVEASFTEGQDPLVKQDML